MLTAILDKVENGGVRLNDEYLRFGPFGSAGGGERGGYLVRYEAFATLLLQALFSAALSDLDHVVLPSATTFLDVHGNLVPVPADLCPRARPQRHCSSLCDDQINQHKVG
jgi:hypothetical protein